jgi:hypothetical protein
VDLGSTIFTPLLTTSYQKSYGGMYAATTDVYEAAYAPTIEGLLPSATAIGDLYSSGKLPPLALFTDTPTPTGNAQLDAILAPSTDPLFSLGFGPANLVKQDFRVAYLLDAFANPDGAVPVITDLQPAAAPQLPLRQKLKLNDLRSWVPATPVLMCGGANDPVVFFSVNTVVMENFWTMTRGVPPQLVPVLDLEAAISGPTDPFAQAKGGFQQTEASIFAQGGQSAVVQTYHQTVAPFCSAAARGFFDSFLAAP